MYFLSGYVASLVVSVSTVMSIVRICGKTSSLFSFHCYVYVLSAYVVKLMVAYISTVKVLCILAEYVARLSASLVAICEGKSAIFYVCVRQYVHF